MRHVFCRSDCFRLPNRLLASPGWERRLQRVFPWLAEWSEMGGLIGISLRQSDSDRCKSRTIERSSIGNVGRPLAHSRNFMCAGLRCSARSRAPWSSRQVQQRTTDPLVQGVFARNTQFADEHGPKAWARLAVGGAS